jgi:malate dehydrogenase
MSQPIRIAITGAAGRISYALVFRIASGGMFGASQPVELRLLDVPDALPLLDATILELVDSCFPLLQTVRRYTDPGKAFDHADWVIMIGSRPSHPGIPRAELLVANAPILMNHGRAINEASPSARVLVVANPSNTNCSIAQSFARDVPVEHWFAMTRLDQNRAQAMVADKAGVRVDQVSRMTVWGNHSESIFPDFHNAYIGENPAPEVIDDPAWVRDVFEPAIRNRGQDLLHARGASPAGSAAQAIVGTIRAIANPTPVLHRFSAAVASDGNYGVPKGLIFGFPLRTEDGTTWSIVPNLYLDAHAQECLAASVAELERDQSVITRVLRNIHPRVRDPQER